MVERSEVARRTKTYREASQKRREDVAADAKVSMSTIEMLEQGRRLPRIETLDKIADALGISVLKLLADDRRPAAA